MGSSEADAAAKAPKSSAAAQDQPPATSSTPAAPAYPDWSSFQAYSPIPPHGFFPSPVASSSPAPPFMWGPQPMIHPYGTPPHPYVMYPHGVYAHPSIPPGSHPFPYAMASPNGNVEASGAAPSSMEVDGKSSEGKDKSPLKSSKGSLGSLNMITGKNNNDPGKTSGASANGGFSQSGESGSEASSEGSDANSQNDSQPKTSGGQDSYDETTQNGNRPHSSRNGVPRTPSQSVLNQTMPVMSVPAAGVPGGVVGPTTNLNIGMDYWGTTTPSPIPPIRAKGSAAAVGGAMASSEMWIQDERELKRQRRKQSNRESARRSRLRKQAECEELAQRVDVLKEENASLRAELNQIKTEYDQLLSHNTSLKESLGDTPRGAEDSRLDRNVQRSLDDTHQRPLDSAMQAVKNNTAGGGH